MKSLTSIRFLLILLFSTVTFLVFNSVRTDIEGALLKATLIVGPFVVFSELGRLAVVKLTKNEKGSFLIFLVFLVVIAFLLKVITFNLINQRFTIFPNNGFLFFIPGYCAISAFLILFFWIKKNTDETVRLLSSKQAYLQHSFNALKSQSVIQFLQESLNVSAKTIDRAPNEALVQIEKLTMILRYLLQSRDERFVRLGAEIKNAVLYCELVELQFKKNVHLNVNIPDEFHKTQIPPLVFQLVLENQIKQLNKQEEAFFEIEVYIENNKFVVVKTNAKESIILKSRSEQFLNNLKQRYQLYNKASGVAVSSTKTNYFIKFPLVAE